MQAGISQPGAHSEEASSFSGSSHRARSHRGSRQEGGVLGLGPRIDSPRGVDRSLLYWRPPRPQCSRWGPCWYACIVLMGFGLGSAVGGSLSILCLRIKVVKYKVFTQNQMTMPNADALPPLSWGTLDT